MNTELHNQRLLYVAEHYGKESQLLKLCEELREAEEAAVAFHHAQLSENFYGIASRFDREHFAEELADVQNMIDQCAWLFDIREEIDAYREKKILRQVRRIKQAMGGKR